MTCSPSRKRVAALPELVDDADELVAGDQGEDRVEVAVVDVQVGSADADLVHLDADLSGPPLRGSGTSVTLSSCAGRRTGRPS